MSKCFFVTGTDTEVGKTIASCALLQAGASLGWRCAGYKPIAAGCSMTVQGLHNSDALALQHHSNVALSYEAVNPYALAAATAPHIAAQMQGETINLTRLTQGLQALKKQAQWVVVEGAGGWLTPISATLSLADWVVAEQLPVILVVGMKLGCINHALLTAQAVQHSGLQLAGWIANCIAPAMPHHAPYLTTLRQLLPAPWLGYIPYLTTANQHANTGSYLSLTALIQGSYNAS